MPKTYAEVEERISQAIVAIDTRENVSRNKIAQEFRVPIQRPRSRLNGHPPASTVRGVHGSRLAPDQEKALHDYFVQPDKIVSLPARLHIKPSSILYSPLKVIKDPEMMEYFETYKAVVDEFGRGPPACHQAVLKTNPNKNGKTSFICLSIIRERKLGNEIYDEWMEGWKNLKRQDSVSETA